MLRRRMFIGLAILAGLLSVCELTARIMFPSVSLWKAEAIWEPHDGMGRASARNIDTIVNIGLGDIRVIKDADGCRVSEHPPENPEIQLLAVGDSLLEAYQVDAKDTFSEKIQAALSSNLQLRVRVANTGVSSWGPDQYLFKTKQELASKPYDAVIVFITISQDYIRTPTEHIQAHVKPAPPAFHKAPITWTAFHLGRHSMFFRWLARLKIGRQMRANPQSNHLLLPVLKSRAEDPMWEATMNRLAEIQQVADTHNTPLLYVLIPPHYLFDEQDRVNMVRGKGLVSNYFGRSYRERVAGGLGIDFNDIDLNLASEHYLALREFGCEVFDTTPALREAHLGTPERLYDQLSNHLTLYGHTVAAESVAPELERILNRRTPTADDPQD